MHAWESFVTKLKNDMGTASIEKWVCSLKVIKFDACNIYLQAKDTFQALWFEEHILNKARREFLNNNNHPIKIHIKVKNVNDLPSKTEATKPSGSFLNFNQDKLNDSYTFSTFHEDADNLCYKFLSKISKKKAPDDNSEIDLSSFNPILIHGPSGCGKTHLLNACAKELREGGKNVFYVKALTFTSHVVNAFRLSSIYDFRNTYRNVDVLIIDDIHLLAGKSATQEELFHTFNTLHSQNNQIILSSNVPPMQLQKMEQRLISRFEWGITLTLTTPEKEKLRKILDVKEKSYALNFDDKTKEFLLNTFVSATEIEKALQAIILRSNNDSEVKKIDLHQTQNYLADLIIECKKIELTSAIIIDVISKYFSIFSEDILGKSQTKECTFPRQLAMYFCRSKLLMPYKKIGEAFNRDHSTVMTNVKFIEKKKSEKDKKIYFTLLDIEKKLPL